MPTLPFLYLPDAVTLILLMLILSTLRSVAVVHLRQELLVIRREMLLIRLAGVTRQAAAPYDGLRALLDSCIRVAPRLSPARLFFLYRLQRKQTMLGNPPPFTDRARAVHAAIALLGDQSAGEKLRRLQMEMNLSLGSFYVMGSLSGWAVLFCLVPRMVKRSVARRDSHRTDSFFDMLERVLGRLGRNAQKLGFATEPGIRDAAL